MVPSSLLLTAVWYQVYCCVGTVGTKLFLDKYRWYQLCRSIAIRSAECVTTWKRALSNCYRPLIGAVGRKRYKQIITGHLR